MTCKEKETVLMIDPGQSMTVSTKDNLLEKYAARFNGMTNATLQLLYTQNGTLLSHTQPFVFTIYPCIQSGQPCPRYTASYKQ
jgi:hypothetical protein